MFAKDVVIEGSDEREKPNLIWVSDKNKSEAERQANRLNALIAQSKEQTAKLHSYATEQISKQNFDSKFKKSDELTKLKLIEEIRKL